jgi:hypothetical protein
VSLAGLRPAGPLFEAQSHSQSQSQSSAFLIRWEAEGMGVQDTPQVRPCRLDGAIHGANGPARPCPPPLEHFRERGAYMRCASPLVAANLGWQQLLTLLFSF